MLYDANLKKEMNTQLMVESDKIFEYKKQVYKKHEGQTRKKLSHI